MREDSLPHTNLYRQRRRETFIQREFHRFSGCQRRRSGCTIAQVLSVFIRSSRVQLVSLQGSVMRGCYAPHTNYHGRCGCVPRTTLKVEMALTGFIETPRPYRPR